MFLSKSRLRVPVVALSISSLETDGWLKNTFQNENWETVLNTHLGAK